MTVCSKCGKDNQDHYKFCLGCGAELGPNPPAKKAMRPPVVEAPAPVVSVMPTPPSGVPPVVSNNEFSAPSLTHRGTVAPVAAQGKSKAPPLPTGDMALRTTEPESNVQAAPLPNSLTCPSCATVNPKEFVFCGNCGMRLQMVAGPRTIPAGAAKTKPTESQPLGKLGLIRPDGSEGGQHFLRDDVTTIGRGVGQLFDHDSYLSPTHARFTFQDSGVILEDIGSLNGVFVKITGDEPLLSGDIFRIGQELLRFDAILEPALLEDGTEIMGSPNPGYWGRLSVIMGPGLDGSAFPLMGDEMVLGRERGDILFSDDGYVSGTHAKISIRENGYFLTDLGSSNGTFIRITQPRLITSNTFMLVGQQLFRFEQL